MMQRVEKPSLTKRVETYLLQIMFDIVKFNVTGRALHEDFATFLDHAEGREEDENRDGC